MQIGFNSCEVVIAPYLHGVPDFPKVCVPQGCLCSDAFIWVVGKHLIEQRQSWSRAARDQPGDTSAFFREEVEMHGSRPATERKKNGKFLTHENQISLLIWLLW